MNVQSHGAETKFNYVDSRTNIELNRNDDKKDYEIMQDNHIEYDYAFKVIIVGETGVGKSCIASKGVKDFYPSNQKCTIAFEHLNFIIRLDDSYVKLNIWDTSGQEAYKSIVTNFYRNTALAIIVYAIDDRNSFDLLDSWIKELRTKCNPDVKAFVVGNKNDLENRRVNREDAIKFIEENKIDLFIETSAKTGENIEKIFVEATRVLLKEYLSYMKIANENNSQKYVSNRARSFTYNTNSSETFRNSSYDRKFKENSFLLSRRDSYNRSKSTSSSCNCSG